MSEETDAPEGGAEAIVEHETLDATPAVEVAIAPNADDTAAQQTEAEETGQADDAGEEAEQPKRVPWFQKRIDEVTAKKYEAEREAAYWRGIAEGKSPQQPAQPQAQEAPDRWDDPEGHDRWLIAQAKRELLTETQQVTALQSFEERAAKVRQSKPDFDSVVGNPNLPVSETMWNVIRESDGGPEVFYHLGQNPQEARRIAALPDYRQAAELGKLEAKLSHPAPAPAPRTPPPPPPQTVAGLSAGIAKAPEDMSMSEYIKWRSKGD